MRFREAKRLFTTPVLVLVKGRLLAEGKRPVGFVEMAAGKEVEPPRFATKTAARRWLGRHGYHAEVK